MGYTRRMTMFDRIYALHKELSAARYPVTNAVLQQRLQCSAATIKRIIRDMRLYLDAPIEYDREYNGYYYEPGDDTAGARFELPGLWFSAPELAALLAMEQLLETTQSGLLSTELAPIRQRLGRILDSREMGAGELARRTRILRAQARRLGDAYAIVAAGVAMRRRVAMTYHGRQRDAPTERTVSPQRLTYYRDNWYLDAWCHRADGLRSFAVDRIRRAELADEVAHDIDEALLDKELGSGYGIFAGAEVETAVLRFSAGAASRVADEQWHPQQRYAWLDDGRYELHVPYAQPRELLRDVLAYGPEVEVVAPQALRSMMHAQLQKALTIYS